MIALVAEQPAGTVTLVFTDIEGSSRLLKRLGRDRYADALEQHRRLLRDTFERYGGYEVDCEGDAFFVAFQTAEGAVRAAEDAQRALAAARWPDQAEFRVRVGIHTGEPLVTPPQYVGMDVHRAARIMAAGHGGQVVLSQTTRDLLDDRFEVRDLGQHRLKDLTHAQRLFQLEIEGLSSVFPPLKTLENRPTNLPAQPSSLIGREFELSAVCELLRSRHCRLLTLTGTGGTGKSRLALQAAADLVDEFSNGVFFVPLAPLVDPALVIPTVAQTLGLRERSDEPLVETLCSYVAGRRMLLILDNFEQVVDAAPLVASMLAAAPELTALVTSRTPLNVSGERTYEVPPLAVPQKMRVVDVQSFAQYGAVALFIERAQAVKADFAVTDEDAPVIAKICARLDGLPLAIELAAARSRALPPKTLLSRLEKRLQLLTGGARDRDPRQQTLRATIDWSYELLSEAEQILFARLAVFVGGSRLEAFEDVAEPTELGMEAADAIQSLVDKSLARQRLESDGEPRFWMLEATREYAMERLAERDDAAGRHERHAKYYLEYVERIVPASTGAWTRLSKPAMDALDAELANIRSALDHFVEHAMAHEVLQLGAMLTPFFLLRTHFVDARQWLDQAPVDDVSVDKIVRANALNSAGAIAFFVSDDVDRAEAFWAEMYDLGRKIDDRHILATAIGRTGNIAWRRGDLERALSLHERAVHLVENEEDADVLLQQLHFIGEIQRDLGNRREAKAALESSLEYAEEIDAVTNAMGTIHSLADLALDAGDTTNAIGRYVTVAERAFDYGDNRVVVYCLAGIAGSLSVTGDHEEAARLWGVVEAQERDLGFRIFPTERRRYERAMRFANEALGARFHDLAEAGARKPLVEIVTGESSAVADARATGR